MEIGDIELRLTASVGGTRVELTREYQTTARNFRRDVDSMLTQGAANLLADFHALPEPRE